MTTPSLRKSYLVDTSHGEVYTGGPVTYHAGFKSLITPQEGRINTLPLQNTGVYIFPISGDDSRVMAVAAHPTNGRLAVAFQSGLIRIYEPTLKTKSVAANQITETKDAKIEGASVRYTWTEIGKWKCDMVTWLAWDNFETSNPLLAAASADGTVKVFDQVGGYCTHNFRGHSGPVSICKFDKATDAKSTSWTLFSAGQDCTVRAWSLKESKQIGLLKNHMSPVTDIDFINHEKTGRKIVTVGRDQIISVYNMDKNFSLYTTIPTYESLESCVVLTPNMSYPLNEEFGGSSETSKLDPNSTNILVAGESGVLKIWNSKSAKCVFEQPKSNAKSGIDYLLYIPQQTKSSKKKKTQVEIDVEKNLNESEALKKIQAENFDKIVAVTNDQNMIIHDMKTMNAGDTIVGYNDEIIDAVFINPNEVAVATNSTELRVFSLPSFSSKTFGFNDPTCAQHKEPIMALALSPCKQFIVTASKDQTLIVWSVLTGKSIAQLTGHTQSISSVQFFNKTSRYIVSGGRDLTWKIWDISPVIEKGHHRSGIDRVAGSILTVKSHSKDVNCVAVSPNDSILATGSQDKDIKLFTLDKVGQRVVKEYGVLRGHRRGVWDVAFSPVDQVIASCSADMTVKLWSLTDFTCIKTFEGHTASTLKVRFITSGLQLLTSGADGLIKLWNIHDNECVNTFDKHDDKIWGLAVDTSTDGARFVSGGGDSMLCLWADNTESEVEAEALMRDEAIQLEQSLNNYVNQKNYRKALKLSLKLDKPAKALSIFESVMNSEPEHDAIFKDMVGSLDFDLTQKLLTYIRDWNTNAKFSLIAQSVLFQLFHTYRADSMTKFPLMKDLLQALIPYSTRHFQRIDKLIQASYILDYTLEAMNLLPDVEEKTLVEESKMESVEESTAEPQNNVESSGSSQKQAMDEKFDEEVETPKRKKNAKRSADEITPDNATPQKPKVKPVQSGKSGKSPTPKKKIVK